MSEPMSEEHAKELLELATQQMDLSEFRTAIIELYDERHRLRSLPIMQRLEAAEAVCELVELALPCQARLEDGVIRLSRIGEALKHWQALLPKPEAKT